jgi:hypothetical protein
MQLRIIHIAILILLYLLTSCVFIQQVRENRNSDKSNTANEKDRGNNNDRIENIPDEITVIKKPEIPVSDSGKYIWYHPNRWWKIKTEPFPVSADSFEYRMMRPQYGFPLYFNTDLTRDKKKWDEWLINNKMYNEISFAGHAWRGIIENRKAVIAEHPEYLAEVNGVRLGYGKTNKFCVSNPDIPNLVFNGLTSILSTKSNAKFIGIEPSDGYGFCQCNGCSKLGSVSNQVFFLANHVAARFKETEPDKMVNIYAYNLHSDTPSFKLDETLVVAVIPGGFQTIYPQRSMLTVWSRFHKNLYWRDYFGIPQWTSDLPRIDVEEYLTRTEIAQREGYKALVMETGMNLNAALLHILFNAKWMNKQLSWDYIFNKFISDCFPESKIPMTRLFKRWHFYWLGGVDEFPATLFDLKEALSIVKNESEKQRIFDIIAYSRMMYLLEKWKADRNNDSNLAEYIEYVISISTRNLAHPLAIISSYNQHFKSDHYKKTYSTEMLKTYNYKYLTSQQIESNFYNDLKNVTPVKIDFEPLFLKDIKNIEFEKTQFSDTFRTEIKQLNFISLYSMPSLKISAYLSSKNADDTVLISIHNSDNSFSMSKIMRNNEVWKLDLKKSDTYSIHVHRAPSANIKLEGKFIPILHTPPAKLPGGYSSFSYINGWKPLKSGEKILQTSPNYFIMKE